MNIAVLMMYNKLLTLFPGKYPVLPGKPLNKAGNAIIFLKKDAPFSLGIFFLPARHNRTTSQQLASNTLHL